ncbi:MAG: hypothetical protein K9J42_16030 [Sulfuritalea sp.]|nr:hypothetical protein [Sulfuritalea sp.]
MVLLKQRFSWLILNTIGIVDSPMRLFPLNVRLSRDRNLASRAWLIAIGVGLVIGPVVAWAGDKQTGAPVAAESRSPSPSFDQSLAQSIKTRDALDLFLRWREIQTTALPARLIELCKEFERDFPRSRHVQQIADIVEHARVALEIQRSIGLSNEGFDDAAGDSDYRRNLIRAVNGDKDAAYRIAMAYRIGRSGLTASTRRTEQWLRFSAELGNGQASWKLAETFNNNGLVADAARFEKLALALGYRPPVRLPSRGY